MAPTKQEELVASLNSFDADTRRRALQELMMRHPVPPEERPWVNMHLHTFFSYNGEGWSPSRLAWEARQIRLYAMGICDFDVLTGLDELLHAADQLGLRSTVGFESRTFFSEYRECEINSPGEPGVFYFMGVGFVAKPAEDSQPGRVFDDMLSRSHRRNRALIDRINSKLDAVSLDYENDVLPRTPAGNATERHIVWAYHEKALAECGGADNAAAFWARNLGLDEEKLRDTIVNSNTFVNMLRSKLIKQGGLGYKQPDESTFPLLDDVIEMISASRAVPTSTWLDGTSAGESDPRAQLECLMDKGVAATNIIPDRNWNIDDPDAKARKMAELKRYVAAANELNLPILVGTELNKPGQRFVDDFESSALKPFAPTFLDGARVLVGHTRLLRYADLSYTDEAAAAEYPNRAERNAAFAAVGALPAPDRRVRKKLTDASPADAFSYLRDSAKNERWL